MPESIGFLFPGQGSQFVGMGRELFEKHAAARRIFDLADNLLGFSISEVCFQGPEDKLTRTFYAQPAIFVTSMAVLAVLKETFPSLTADFFAGLSLGEFSALTAAEAISFPDALLLVQKRAEAMEQAARSNPGSMASILGLSPSQCEIVAAEAGCEIANFNSPEQTVLSGTLETIQKACKIAESKGAKRAIVLKVGGAFHSNLMQPARDYLETALQQTHIRSPKSFFIPNTTAKDTRNSDEIRRLLSCQLTSPVRWVETMAEARIHKIDFLLEIGPGKVLKGLAKKCEPNLVVESCGNYVDIEKIQALFAQT